MTHAIKAAAVFLLAALVSAPAFAQAPSANTYKSMCVSCHGADGLAATPIAKSLKVLSFKDPAMLKASDAQFIASTTNGKGKMPAYKDKLTSAQIKDVVAYIRKLQK
jgi:cytochrome c6